MSAITRDMPVADLAALVCQHLADHGIEAVLTGGAVVTIYSENEYQSNDLDFITTSRRSALLKAMSGLGFTLTSDRYFAHPDTPFYVEFPAPPLAIGNEPVTSLAEQRRPTGVLRLLTPTQCVMDRLAAYYHWDDRQSFRQAALVAARHSIDWAHVERWSKAEGHALKYRTFRDALAQGR